MVPLPPYARRVEYLESTGTQWIDTGVVPNPQTEIRLQATVTQTAGRGLVYTYPQIENSELRLFFNLSGATFYYDRGPARLQYGTTVRNLDIVATNYALYLSGTQVKSGNVQSWTGTTSLRVFGNINNGGKYDLMRLRALQILDGSTPVRSFVPCRILDVGYLWDEVEGKFYGNQGTGDFVLGPDVREGVVPTRMNPFGIGRQQEKIRRVEYLESTGTQWIDTLLGYFPEFEIGAVVPGAVGNNTLGIDQSWKLGRHSADKPVWRASINNGSYITSVSCGTYADMSYHGTTFKCNSDTITVPANKYVSGTMVLFSTGAALPTAYPLKLYYCRLFDQNGSIVRDFVPVAIGSTGYLLDRVSGRLFGNSGTGDFVVGPDIVPRLRVWGNGQGSSLFDISTPYPLAAGNPVTGTVNGDARSGILASDLYTVNDAGGDYVGEFIDMTPGGTETVALRWFDRVAGSPLVGYCEIVQ